MTTIIHVQVGTISVAVAGLVALWVFRAEIKRLLDAISLAFFTRKD